MMDLPETDSEDELAPGWEERVTTDGNVYYVNHGTKVTQWTHPRTNKKKYVSGNLPFGWEKCVDQNTGKIFFVHQDSGRTTYTDPRLAFAQEEKEHPYDIRQKFDASSTALQVLHGKDLTGQIALVTGANTGIGYETARSLVKHNCKVILACRNLDAAKAAVEQLSSERLDYAANCDVMRLNLSSLHDIRSFAEAVSEKYNHLDMLILNAGVFGLSHSTTVDNYETTFQVNHLGHYYLTRLLSRKLKRGSRVVIVSSESHRFSKLNIDNISERRLSPDGNEYWSMGAYNDSKLCNVLFAYELTQRWEARGILVFVLHPGNMMSTSLSRNWWFWRLLFFFVRPFTKSLQQGAATTVYCATAPEIRGLTGLYFNNCHICNVSVNANDPKLAQKLWDISANMIRAKVGPEPALQ